MPYPALTSLTAWPSGSLGGQPHRGALRTASGTMLSQEHLLLLQLLWPCLQSHNIPQELHPLPTATSPLKIQILLEK